MDGVLAGRAQLEATWPPPPRMGKGQCAGDQLLREVQRAKVTVMTRAVGDYPVTTLVCVLREGGPR